MSKPTEFSTVKEIKEYLDSKGVEYHKRAKKGELVKLLQAVPDLENEELDVTEQTMLPANPKRDYMTRLLSGNDDFLRNLDSYVFLHADGSEMQKALQEAKVKLEEKDARDSAIEPEFTSYSQAIDEDRVIDLDELNEAIESEAANGVSVTEAVAAEATNQIEVIEDTPTSESNEEPVATEPVIDEDEVKPVSGSVEDEIIEVVSSKDTELSDTNDDEGSDKKRLALTISGVMLAVFLIVFFTLKYLM